MLVPVLTRRVDGYRGGKRGRDSAPGTSRSPSGPEPLLQGRAGLGGVSAGRRFAPAETVLGLAASHPPIQRRNGVDEDQCAPAGGL